jgi:hypothetical protein
MFGCVTRYRFQVEQFINLGAFVVKGHVNSIYAKKLSSIQKRADEITQAMKTQQL